MPVFWRQKNKEEARRVALAHRLVAGAGHFPAGAGRGAGHALADRRHRSRLHGAKRELTIHLVRIFFPGAGLLVFSAWCLGILNSHRKFFISYTAPVAWNAAIVAALIGFGGHMTQFPLAIAVAWGSVIGSGLQLGVQLPAVLRLLGEFRLRFGWRRRTCEPWSVISRRFSSAAAWCN